MLKLTRTKCIIFFGPNQKNRTSSVNSKVKRHHLPSCCFKPLKEDILQNCCPYNEGMDKN